MKMKSCFLLLYFGLTCCQGVNAEHEHDVKRGMFPYMAFIYYSDDTVLDVTGQRFIRSAVLIRPDWLVTTALGPSLLDPTTGFPTKTLLARTGAITIDAKFTLNEDEDEQEREIVQIVRPYNHSATQWWTTDISLMKTLLPFNMTSAVGIKTLNIKQEMNDVKTCSILIYAKKVANITEDKKLLVLYVELLPPSIDNCGSHFAASSMVCAANSDDNKDVVNDSDFCYGNSGGPLICENEVVGLQTYIEYNCKQPHLYQLLSAWDNFITCGIENKCQEELCGNICDVSYKDPPKVEIRITSAIPDDTAASDMIELVNVLSTTEDVTTEISISSIESLTELAEISLHPTMTSLTDETQTQETTSTMTESLTTLVVITETPEAATILEQTQHWPKVKETENILEKEIETSTKWAIENNVTTTTMPTEEDTTFTEVKKLTWHEKPKMRTWPKEKPVKIKYREHATEDPERKAKVEAQQHSLKAKQRSTSNSNMCFIQTVLFGFTVLLCL